MGQTLISMLDRLDLSVDAICSLLQGPRASGAFLMRSSMSPPWSMRIRDEAPLTIVAMVRGDAWVVFDDGDDGPVALHRGDVALLRGPDHYVVADDPATPPQVVIEPGQVCRTIDGHEAFDALAHSIRSWGNHAEGPTLMVTGTYETAGQVSDRLLRALPRISVVRSDEWETPLIALLATEIVKDEPGQSAILDRVLDLLCLAAVRACFTRPGAEPPGWYRAGTDPVIGPALELIHNNPSEPWSVATLAAQVGASRAAFARRFTESIGEPPLTYLTNWRLDLAADRLVISDASVNGVARRGRLREPVRVQPRVQAPHGQQPVRVPAAGVGVSLTPTIRDFLVRLDDLLDRNAARGPAARRDEGHHRQTRPRWCCFPTSAITPATSRSRSTTTASSSATRPSG